MAENNKELRRLRRHELLEILVTLSEENDELRRENEELKAKLKDRNIRIEEAGSLAEASLKLSGIFQAAQEAADLYLENIRKTEHIE